MFRRTAFVAAVLVAGGALAAPEFEASPTPDAAKLVRPELQQGAHHKLRPGVTMEGYLARFEVESEFGLYQVTSISLLEKRVHEINTLAKALAMKEESPYLAGVAESLKQTVTAPVKIITDPFGSLAAMGTSVGKTVKKIGLLFKKRDKSAQEDKGLKAAMFGAEKRKLASELNLDVYTDNSKVQEFLDSVASGRGSGKLTISLATLAIPGGAGIAVGVAKYRGGVDDALRDLSPAELHERNMKKLLAMGINEFLAKSFLNHPKLSPRHKTLITADLEALAGVEERGAALEAAVDGAEDHVGGAQFYENLTGMLVALHKEKHPLKRLHAVEGVVVAHAVDGKLVVALPVDLVHWSAETAEAFGDFAALDASGARVLVVTGKLTDRAREGITAKGFTVMEGFLASR